MAIEDLLQRVMIPAPVKGLLSLDPALPDALYSPLHTPDTLNLRLLNGLVECRKGLTSWDPDSNSGTTTFGATGACTLLHNYYPSSGTVYRLAAIGGNLKQMTAAGTSFANATGGTGFSSSNPWSAVTLSDFVYFSDRSAGLKKWDPTNGVQAVAQPAAPGSGPTVTPWTYGILDAWDGNSNVAPYGWTESDATNFTVDPTGATEPEFAIPGNIQRGRSVTLAIDSSGSKGDTITKNAAHTLSSSTIACWAESSVKNWLVSLEIGVNVQGEVSFPFGPFPEKEEGYPLFFSVGALTEINYLRFRCRKTPNQDRTLTLSPLVLPGRLQGFYRWRYTHYNPTTGAESEPSPISNDGTPTDLSTIGTSYKPESAKAFQKCAMLAFTSDSGSDAATTKIRVYRNGGVPSLTKDSRGQDVWLRVGEVYDHATTVSGNPSAAATSFSVAAAGNIAAGDWLILDAGTSTEEYVYVDSIASTTITCTTTPLQYAHSNGDAVQIAFLDNVSNQALAGTVNVIDAERDDPPAGAHWVAKAPDGRLWLFRYSGKKLGVAVSNRATVERPYDHEVFPSGVDPLTKGHPTQGWRFNVAGDASGDEIVWGGFFNGVPTVLTRKALYQIDAYAQDQWSPTSVRKVLEVGCLAGETVQVVNDTLFWVSEGPRVLAWNGQGAPRDLSTHKIDPTLDQAPSGYWSKWFARGRSGKEGAEYWLFLTPSGGTTNTRVLRYNLVNDSWEAHTYNNGSDLAWDNALVWDGASDAREFVLATAAGTAFYGESGSTDAGTAISVRLKTKRFRLPEDVVGQVERVWLRGLAASDSVSVTVYTGGSEYGQQSATYSSLSFSGSNDKELVKRTAFRTLRGRWVQLELTGSLDDGLDVRELSFDYSVLRRTRLTL